MADQNSVITHARRVHFAKMTAGEIDSLAPVTMVAFGDGGVNAEGEVIPPDEMQTALRNEIGRYEISEISHPVDTTTRYVCMVPSDDLVGKGISEAALVDRDGMLCAIRNTLPKYKDAGEEFEFRFDDEF